MTETVRLAKRVAALVPCSRREAEQYIEGGRVRVDGVVIETPQFRVGDQRVEIDLDASAGAPTLAAVTLLLHKPAGAGPEEALRLLVADQRADNPDLGGDAGVMRTHKRHFAHLVCLMPLPAQASGLMVYSQDRRVVRKLTEDAMHIEQELVLEVTGEIAPDGLRLLGHGLRWRGEPLPPARVSWQSERRLRFAHKGIAPDMIPWMCEQVGLGVSAYKRIRLGRLPMAGLPASRWRYLGADERF